MLNASTRTAPPPEGELHFLRPGAVSLILCTRKVQG